MLAVSAALNSWTVVEVFQVRSIQFRLESEALASGLSGCSTTMMQSQSRIYLWSDLRFVSLFSLALACDVSSISGRFPCLC